MPNLGRATQRLAIAAQKSRRIHEGRHPKPSLLRFQGNEAEGDVMLDGWEGGAAGPRMDAESHALVRRARARLLGHFDQKALELEDRAQRLRHLLEALEDVKDRADAVAMIAQLTALAELNRSKASRLRAISADQSQVDPHLSRN